MVAHSTAIYFADALCRERALTDDETDMLERLISGKQSRMWTAAEDRQLAQAIRRSPRRYASELAALTGRTEWSIRSRARKLKRKAK